MNVLISAEGDHDPKGLLYMQVDRHGFLIDLSTVVGNLVEPTIKRVEWGPVIVDGGLREGGTIVRLDGGRQTFFDQGLLKPYLDAWRARKAGFDAVTAELAKAPA